MAKHLIVTGAFGSYARGDQITDPNEVEAVLRDHGAHVVPINVSDDLEPRPPADEPGAPA